MVDWSIEAYREDTEELAWQLLLDDLEGDDLERELRISLPTPDSYVITVAQVVAAIRASSSEVSLGDLDLSDDRLSFFLTATEGSRV